MICLKYLQWLVCPLWTLGRCLMIQIREASQDCEWILTVTLRNSLYAIKIKPRHDQFSVRNHGQFLGFVKPHSPLKPFQAFQQYFYSLWDSNCCPAHQVRSLFLWMVPGGEKGTKKRRWIDAGTKAYSLLVFVSLKAAKSTSTSGLMLKWLPALWCMTNACLKDKTDTCITRSQSWSAFVHLCTTFKISAHSRYCFESEKFSKL